MQKAVLLLACLFLLQTNLISQDFNNYQPLESEGKIPEDFLTLSSDLYKLEKERISQERKRREKLSEQKFYLESSFELRDLLFSGKILFNDPVSKYLNKVADSLLAGEKELRKKIRIYAVKSAHVNAFATNSGMVLINLGLISQLENESQLAFIIAHEVVHFKNKHVLDNYVETDKIIRGKGMYKNVSLEEKLLARNNYSKEKESEADLEGIELFLKSGYSTENLLGAFDVLQYSYLPFDEIKFKRSFFQTENLVFPDEYFLEKTQDIAIPEEEDDEKSTHPSIDKRRAYISTKIDKKKNEGKKDFLISEEEFINVRKLTRFEICRLYISNLQYEKAIYHTYLLLQEDPENKYLNKMLAKALYGMSKYYNAGQKHVVHKSYKKIEGESQQVNHLLDKIKSDELNAIALKFCWKVKKRFPDDKETEMITEDLMKSLVFEHFPSRDRFSATAKSEFTDSLSVIDSTEMNKLSKYDKIKLNQEKQKIEEEQKNYIYFAFVENLQDPEFNELFDKYAKEKEIEDNKKEETYKERTARLKQQRKEARLKERKGEALGLDKIVVFNTFYLKYDMRKKQKKKYIQSESAEIALNQKIMENCDLAGLDYEFIDDLTLADKDVEKFNDLAMLNTWMMERFEHVENDVKMVNMDAYITEKLAKKYGTDNFYWMGIVNQRSKKTGTAYVFALTLMFWPILPVAIIYAATPHWDTYHFSVMLDLNKGSIDKVNLDKIKGRDADYLLNSTLYDTFYQFKRKSLK